MGKNWQNIKNHLSMQISKLPMILHPWSEKYAKNLELQQKERKENSQMIQKHQNVPHLDFSYSVQIIDQEYKKNAVIALLLLENSLDKNGKAEKGKAAYQKELAKYQKSASYKKFAEARAEF